MKFAALSLAAIAATTAANKPTNNRRLASCLGEFTHTFTGDCSLVELRSQVETLIAGQPGCTDAETELANLVGVVPSELPTTVEKICASAYAAHTEGFFPYQNITLMGDTFDREFLNGGSILNTRVETSAGEERLSSGMPGYRIPLVHDASLSQGIGWPSNPAISSVQNCELGAAMCCYVSDRQSGDDGGLCDAPDCAFADPQDNTDICYVDMSRAPASARVRNGVAVYDKRDLTTDSEGNAYCHGFAWDAEDGTAASSRYKGNLLFEVAMHQNLFEKGYVQNVPGAPMCGCIEKMPVVSNAACTDLTASETWTIEGGAEFSISISDVDITYNDCVDLATQYSTVNPNSDLTDFLVGEDNCESANTAFLETQGLVRSTLYIAEVLGHPSQTTVFVKFNSAVADEATAATYQITPGITVTGAEMHPTDKSIVVLTTTEQALGVEYSLTVTGLVVKRVAPMIKMNTEADAEQILSPPTFNATSYGYANNVDESSQYTLAYDLELPNTKPAWSNALPEYEFSGEEIGPISRIAYFMELESIDFGHEWVWVSMPQFTQNTVKAGVPVFAAGTVYQNNVDDMNVFTNQKDIAPDGSFTGVQGNMEFWPNSYHRGNAAGVEGANNNLYDFGDGRSTGGNYGSMQIHMASIQTTLFAMNRFGGARADNGIDIGIGNRPIGDPDWTFAENAQIYSVKKLSVLVMKNEDPAAIAAFTAPQGQAAALDDSAGYKIAYELEIPNTARYSNVAPLYEKNYVYNSFEHVAYYVELQKTGATTTEWLWVSMKKFTDEVTKIGVPTFASGAIFQQYVEEMNVYSSNAALNATNITGFIEFWPNNYGTGNVAGVPGANSNKYDVSDHRSGSGNYGSMQIHNPGDGTAGGGTTLFAFNDFNRGAQPCVGIGNNPNTNGHPDWTFQNNAQSYSVKKLQVLVK